MKYFFLLLALLVIALTLSMERLGTPPEPVFDEVYYLPPARALSAGNPDTKNWVHPPLAKFLIGESIRIFGDRPFAWRFPSVLAFLSAAGFFYLIAVELFKEDEPLIPFVAALLYLMDGLTLVQSRIAMLDMLMVGFLIPSVYFFIKKKYVFSSVLLGLSLSCKWGAFFIFPLYFLTIPFSAGFKKCFAIYLELIFPCIVIYFFLFSFFLFGFRHYALHPGRLLLKKEWTLLAGTTVEKQKEMLKFHLRPKMEHPYKAPWWKWLFLIRPIWYHYKSIEGNVRGIVALPNPFFWWPALLASFLLLLKLKEDLARFILTGAALFTIPWALSLKGGFMYYLLPASPFLVLAYVYWLRRNKLFISFGLGSSLAGFVLFFPLYTDWPVSQAYFQSLMWLRSWI